MKPLHVLILGLAVAVVGLAMHPRQVAGPSLDWPGAQWTTSTPEEQGMDSGRLANLVEHLRHDHSDLHSLTVVRNGRLVLDASFFPYRAGDLHDMASVTKSVTSTLIGAAINDGYLRSSDQTVVSLLPECVEADPRLRLQDLLSMRPGFAWSGDDDEGELDAIKKAENWPQAVLRRPAVYSPGSRFVYCSGGMHVLSAVISKCTGVNAADYARQRLFGPLGISRFEWPADAAAVTFGWGDLHLRPADAARLGLLWLRGGEWDGRRLLPASWMVEVTRERSATPLGGYGEGFWVDTRATPTRFQALGRDGQHITVIPDCDLVIVVTGGGLVPRDLDDKVLQAVRADHGLPEDRSAALRLSRAVELATHPPPPWPVTPLPARAARVSRLSYRCPPNRMGLQHFRLCFDGGAEVNTDMKFEGHDLFHPKIGLDRVPRITPGGRYGLPVGLTGGWESDDVFVFDYQEIANINQFRLRLRFSDQRPPTLELSRIWSRAPVQALELELETAAAPP